ncbi:hypothetical protein O6H91_01G117700 [Diphasiastrum complanatum]|uniref:Uncharacterized protein n=5 Tax=Diphasiastrum complanatum TaxID=34168 RepID=A0ACC2EV68_DIPCM|nr:hypothetical protein O6H91_01G117700 [Diphasiastrum complanatum]KAJ7570388.1 hypothetical protein O6H91_01G117700 [Diphasiastrum complanatum]
MQGERDGIVHIVSSQNDLLRMSTAMANSDVVSSLASNQSGLASLSDDAEGQICDSSSQISPESGAALKLCDYIGLSEVSSASLPLASSREDRQHDNTLPRISYKINLQETELTLGPSKALPSFQLADNGAPFQPNDFCFLPITAERKKKEMAVLPEQKYAFDIHHASNVTAEMNYRTPGFEMDEKNIKFCEGIDDLGYDVPQKGFILRDDHHGRHVKSRGEGLDLGCGLFPCLPHLYEEVGENKVSSGSGGIEEQTFLDPQKQCLEHGNLTDIKHHEKGQVMRDLEEPMEDKERRKCIAVNTSPNQITVECFVSNKLQEVTISSKYWRPQTTVALTDAVNNLAKHESDPHQYFFPALKTPLIGTKRSFSEALGGGSAAINATLKIVTSRVADEGESQVYDKHSIPPLFPWNPSKQSFASWTQQMEHSGRRFNSFPSSLSPDDHSETLSEGSADCKLSNSKFGDGSNDEGTADEDGTTLMVPRTPVGWPPVQSFRKNCLPRPHHKTIMKTEAIAFPTPVATKLHIQSNCSYVKVYIDGLPIGRKVDLHIHDGYDKLSLALENMFKSFIHANSGDQNSVLQDMTAFSTGKKMNFFGCSEYVLTYEDKDGDLMLVGDVPWGMFIMTVKRLRIMKGSEAIGLAPKTLEDIIY